MRPPVELRPLAVSLAMRVLGRADGNRGVGLGLAPCVAFETSPPNQAPETATARQKGVTDIIREAAIVVAINIQKDRQQVQAGRFQGVRMVTS